jgi:short-subunit dehydrogenase involved in D-alanine esterification of teichoic acids
MDVVSLEFTTNYLSYLALTKELIPFLKNKHRAASLIYVSSNLALVPLPARSNYCATKAALHQWILSLRASQKGNNLKIVEIYPPAVQTELHDQKHQPDIVNGREMGMPLAEFTNEVSSGNQSLLVDLSLTQTCIRPGRDFAVARMIYLLA